MLITTDGKGKMIGLDNDEESGDAHENTVDKGVPQHVPYHWTAFGKEDVVFRHLEKFLVQSPLAVQIQTEDYQMFRLSR